MTFDFTKKNLESKLHLNYYLHTVFAGEFSCKMVTYNQGKTVLIMVHVYKHWGVQSLASTTFGGGGGGGGGGGLSFVLIASATVTSLFYRGTYLWDY